METGALKKWIVGDLSRKRVIRSSVSIVLIVYAFFLVYGVFLSDQVIFQPQPSSYEDTDHILKLKMQDGTVISARHLRNPSARYTILYSHGNAEDLGDIKDILQEFFLHGFSIVAYDYNGYGTSTGTPSERAAYANILRVYDYLRQECRLPAEDIIVCGRSVGGGPSVDLASKKRVGGLIIESSFTSAFRVMTRIRLYPFDKFDNLKKVSSVSCPVLVIHGTRDRTIPFWHGKTLYEKARSPKMHLWVEQADHNDLLRVAGEKYWTAIGQFLGLV